MQGASFYSPRSLKAPPPYDQVSAYMPLPPGALVFICTVPNTCPHSLSPPPSLLSFIVLRAPLIAQFVKNLPAMKETWVGKIPWRRKRLRSPVFWPGEFQGLYSPWGRKESDMTERLSLHIVLTFLTSHGTLAPLFSAFLLECSFLEGGDLSCSVAWCLVGHLAQWALY